MVNRLYQVAVIVHLRELLYVKEISACRRSLDEAEVAKSKVGAKLLDAQHELLHLRSSLEACTCTTLTLSNASLLSR